MKSIELLFLQERALQRCLTTARLYIHRGDYLGENPNSRIDLGDFLPTIRVQSLQPELTVYPLNLLTLSRFSVWLDNDLSICLFVCLVLIL